MTTYHIGISIAGALRQKDRNLDGLISIDDRELSGQQIKHYLVGLRQKNPALKLFTGDKCENQGADGGCLGHPDKEGVA